MDKQALERALVSLPLGGLRYFDRVGSTNDQALEWALKGAPDLALVVADEQTRGRGRAGRSWQTVRGAALAFSLVLSPAGPAADPFLPRHAALGGLAVHTALTTHLGLPSQLKWPNDVLVNGKKVAGVLAEGHWLGDSLQAVVLGIGINVSPKAVPPTASLDFPAISLEGALGHPVDRPGLLRQILAALIHWRLSLGAPQFLQAWESALAYRGQLIRVEVDDGPPLEGRLMGLDPEGFLKLETAGGDQVAVPAGVVRLRPAPPAPRG